MKKLDAYKKLVDLHKMNKNLIICEVDVPNNDGLNLEHNEDFSINSDIRFGHRLGFTIIK